MSDSAARRSRRSSPHGEPAGPWSRLLATIIAAGALRSALAGVVILASAVALVWLGQSERSGLASDPMGKAEVSFYLLVNGRRVAGADALQARAGDILRLGITAPARARYAVLYREDGGPLAPYMEPAPERAAGGAKGEDLPDSLVLDSGWRRSVLYCVSSDRPFTLAQAEAAVEGMVGDVREAAEDGLRIQTFHLENASP